MTTKPRVLFVSDRIPGNMARGDSQRVSLLYKALDRVADTEMLLLADPEVFHPVTAPWLREQFNVIDCLNLPERGEHAPWNRARSVWPALVDRVAAVAGDPAVTFEPYPALANRIKSRIIDGRYD